MKKRNGTLRAGFTLVEMLIVVGVLGILLGLLAPAILRNVKIAQAKSRANERAVLEAAILEFWHDQNRWPIKSGDTPRKAANYKLTYRDNNFEVFNQLVNADFGGRKNIKNYIDTGRHITTLQAETTYPAFSVAPLRDVLEGRNGVSRRNNPVLVYWADFIRCPECNAYADMDRDRCAECNYAFDPGDRKGAVRGLKPYRVVIDMLNNSVSVTD